MSKIFLASTSPYRQELLKKIVSKFDVIDSKFDEEKLKSEVDYHGPKKLSQLLAKGKALAALELLEEQNIKPKCIIASDQVCCLDEKILNKPITETKALEQLLALQGQSHQLHTSVCVAHGFKLKTWTVTTTLKMRSLNKEEIKYYLKKDKPLHSAGSYKIEEQGISLFEHIKTSDYFSIIGLPLLSLGTYLREQQLIS